MNKKILLAGMHNTGKTTFIAALWYMLCHFENDYPVKLGSLEQGEDEYLGLISNCWMRFEPVPRTPQSKLAGEQVIINIKKTSTNEKIILNIPDFSGETFKSHFEDREWGMEYLETVRGLEGIVLFVNPCDDSNQPRLLINQNEIQNFFGIVEDNNSADFVNYDASHTSNQVKLVECLQFIENYAEIQLPIKISIVISLWDKVEEAFGNSLDPEEWMKQHLPLLCQYLNCNTDKFIFNYFGISSQGGDYEQKDLLADLDPMKRVKVFEGKEFTNDISRPILWITE